MSESLLTLITKPPDTVMQGVTGLSCQGSRGQTAWGEQQATPQRAPTPHWSTASPPPWTGTEEGQTNRRRDRTVAVQEALHKRLLLFAGPAGQREAGGRARGRGVCINVLLTFLHPNGGASLGMQKWQIYGRASQWRRAGGPGLPLPPDCNAQAVHQICCGQGCCPR